MRRYLTDSEKLDKIKQITEAYGNDVDEKKGANDYMEEITDVIINDFLYDTDKAAIVHRYSRG